MEKKTLEINKKQVAEILVIHTKSLSRLNNKKTKYQLAKNFYKVLDIAKERKVFTSILNMRNIHRVMMSI